MRPLSFRPKRSEVENTPCGDAGGWAAGRDHDPGRSDETSERLGRARVKSLKLALMERFGTKDDLQDVEIAGMTDSGIVISILNKHEIPVTNENMAAFLDSYVHFLSFELPRRAGNLLPGVLELLEKLKA